MVKIAIAATSWLLVSCLAIQAQDTTVTFKVLKKKPADTLVCTGVKVDWKTVTILQMYGETISDEYVGTSELLIEYPERLKRKLSSVDDIREETRVQLQKEAARRKSCYVFVSLSREGRGRRHKLFAVTANLR